MSVVTTERGNKMKKQHLRFYINRNGRLGIIWFAKRQWVLNGEYRNKKEPVPDDAPQFVVRKQTIGSPSHMRSYFNLECYAWNERDAILFVEHFANKRPVSKTSISDGIIWQLYRAQLKWVHKFIAYYHTLPGVTDMDVTNLFIRIWNCKEEEQKKVSELHQRLKEVDDAF